MIDFIKKPRREPMQLQLTAMIDIFSMIVIFLVLGTVVSGSEVELPANFMLPNSSSKESADSAPRVTISGERVEFTALKISLPLQAFDVSQARNQETLAGLKAQLKNFIERSPASTPQASTMGRTLNVVADQRLPYSSLYDVLSVFKESGFETLLFVTTNKGGN